MTLHEAGYPVGLATLLVGGAGSGKTILALQTLVNGGRRYEPGIPVAFEESSEYIVRNAEAFAWDFPAPQRKHPKTLAKGARNYDERGIFGALDESSGRITANIAKFGLDPSGAHPTGARAACGHTIRPSVSRSWGSCKIKFFLEIK